MSKRKFLDIFRRSRDEPVSQEDLAKYLRGDDTWSGMEVDRQSSMGLTAVWACVRVISESLASLPLILYRRLDKGKERATKHPLYNLLHLKPNPWLSAFQFKETQQGHVVLQGNCYAQKIHGRDGYVKELWPINPERMVPMLKGGVKQFEYRPKDGQTRTLGIDEILHIPGLSYDGVQGYSVLQVLTQSLGVSLAAERYGADFFKNSGRPSGVIKMPGKLKDEAAYKRMKASWQEAHGSWGKRSGTAILEDGAEWQQLFIAPEEAQFIQTRKLQTTEIARIFRVPPHLIADLDRATFSNIEQQSLEFVIHTMRPWLVRWEQALSLQLLPERDQEEYFFEFLVDALLRGDIMARSQAYRTFMEMGALNANEIREMENRNPREGGDVYYVPLNWMPAENAGQQPAVDGTQMASREIRSAKSRHRIAGTYRALLQDAGERIVRKEIRDLKASAKQRLGSRGLAEWEDWLNMYYGELPAYIRKALSPALSSLFREVKGQIADELGIDAEITPENEKFVAAYITTFAQRYVTFSRQDMEKTLTRAIANGEDMVAALEERFEYWGSARPARIGDNESTRGSNAFAHTIYAVAGVMYLRWIAVGPDVCPWCAQLNGRVVGIDGEFALEGDTLQSGDEKFELKHKTRHPPLHVGCVCQIVAG